MAIDRSRSSQEIHSKSMMAAKLVLTVLVLIVGLAAGNRSPPAVTDKTLRSIAQSLKKYIEPLPIVPKLYGYSTHHGHPKSTCLTIGMFRKKWVTFYFL
ncbi:hypothetical protein BHM03_00049179 [Ensete ventricosum]|nr:hypothetical protein BHM03_00049179 [Ensete ventricosum]